MLHKDKQVFAAELGKLLLKTGIGLLEAGAGSHRIVLNLTRIAHAYGFQAHIDVRTRSISVSLHKDQDEYLFSGSRSMNVFPGVNFKVISGISRLSWSITESQIPLEKAGLLIQDTLAEPHYNRWITLAMVGLAGASFCFVFGGTAMEMAAAFIATLAGLALKQELVRKKFNAYIITYASAVMASLVVAIIWKVVGVNRFEQALATCILFLIPGVHLINSVIDLMDGYTANGVERGMNATIHSFAIAAGLGTILYAFQLYK